MAPGFSYLAERKGFEPCCQAKSGANSYKILLFQRCFRTFSSQKARLRNRGKCLKGKNKGISDTISISIEYIQPCILSRRMTFLH
jgi:hypothetical protein